MSTLREQQNATVHDYVRAAATGITQETRPLPYYGRGNFGLASNDPTTFGIRRAARAVGTWIPDSHQVVRPILGRFNGLPVHRLRRVTEEKLFRCDVDEDVLSVVSRLKLGSMPLIELPSDARDFLDAECHLTSTLA